MAADLEFVASLLSAPEGSSSTEAIARSLKRNRQSSERQPRRVRNTSSPGTRRAQQQQLEEREEDARSGLKHLMAGFSSGSCLRCYLAWKAPQGAAAQARPRGVLQALAEFGET